MMDVQKIIKDISVAQQQFSSRVLDYQALVLNPKVPADDMVKAIVFYASLSKGFLDLLAEFDQYYGDRAEVSNALVSELLTIADATEKILGKRLYGEKTNDSEPE